MTSSAGAYESLYEESPRGAASGLRSCLFWVTSHVSPELLSSATRLKPENTILIVCLVVCDWKDTINFGKQTNISFPLVGV